MSWIMALLIAIVFILYGISFLIFLGIVVWIIKELWEEDIKRVPYTVVGGIILIVTVVTIIVKYYME